MAESSPRDVTLLLQNWFRGEERALEKLIPLVYDELHRLAHRYMVRERPDRTLQTSALVNEAYLRLVDAGRIPWKDRAHFFAISANLMRRILVDFARKRGYKKRGGDARKVELNEAFVPSPARGADLVALDEALSELAELDPRKQRSSSYGFSAG